MKKLIIITFVLFLATSCRKEIHFTGEMSEPKIVVNAILQTGNPVEISVSKSAPITSNTEPASLSEAEVLFYQNNTLLGIATEDLETPGKYLMDHEVLAGATYRVEVNFPGLKSVHAETKVPQPIDGYVSSINMDNPPLNSDYSGYSNQLDFIIQDPGSENFYFFYLIEKYQETVTPFTFYSIEPILEGQTEIYHNGGLFSDASFNGTNYTLDVYVKPYETQEELSYAAVLRTINLDLFRYMQSTRVNDDGILTQPVQIYSNIENGIGIFAASSGLEVLLP